MYVKNRSAFLLPWARLAAFYIHSPYENIQTLEKVRYNAKCESPISKMAKT